MSWEDVVMDGLVGNVAGSTVGGLIAAGVAYKTVRWTQRGDREAAVEAERKRAAESLVRATLALIGPLADHIGRGHPDDGEALDVWVVESEVQLPLLEDVPGLADHVTAFREFLSELTTQNQAANQDASVPFVAFADQPSGTAPPTYRAWRRETMLIVSQATSQLVNALQEARRGGQVSDVNPLHTLPRWPDPS